MIDNPKQMRIGPVKRDWVEDESKGDSGNHPMGCIYGGFTDQSSYWLIVPGCPLYHGEENNDL